MKKFLCTILASIFFFSAFAQTINWKRTPGKTFVFEINNKEALKLLKSLPKDSAVLKMLHTPVASFTGTWENKPSRGHFIFADIYENKVGYQYAPVIPYQVFLFKEYGNLSIQVLDSAGNIVSNAKVKLNRTRIDFDKKSNTYTIDDWSSKTERLLTVEFRKFRTVFNLNKHLVYPSWYNNYNGSSYKPEFYSYMLTDKNKYKPHETIRFKSYALSGNRRPIKKELELWLGTEKYGKYKKIKSVVPYNPGGFAGEFTLDDSLKLTLDKNYPLQLRDKTGRIAASTSFRYEDYQLFDNKLQIKLQSVNQFSPDTNKLEIKATDANGLLLKDVAVAVCIKRKDVLNAYTDILQLPDTLMYKRITLDNDKPTVMDIPPGIFKQSDCNYDVEVIALTFENQRMEQRQSATFFSAHYNIVTTTKNDSVCFSFYDLGKEKSISAQLSYDDGKIKKQIQLPYTEKFNQAIAAYHIQPDDYPVKKIITPNDIDAGLDVTGGIIGDSFSVHINNPLQLNISWYIYRGGELLEKGTGKTMDYGYDHVDMETAHYVEMFYTIGKDARMLRRVFVPKENFLSVNLNMPERVYPGQKVDATICVKDRFGSAVSNVDLTAFSVNSLLDYSLPDLPYYGAAPATREQRDSYSMNRKNYLLETPLNFDYWNKLAKLDTLEYYRFAYPRNKMFLYTVNTPDTTTEFAPYIMKDGKAIDIYVIEKNDKPIYFSWTQQPKAYSFLADMGKQKITLRLFNKAIVFDSIQFAPGKKTILSIEENYLPANTKVIDLNNKTGQGYYIFTSPEAERYNKLISEIPVKKYSGYTYLKQDSVVYPVYAECLSFYKEKILAGPIPEGATQYMEDIKYKHEGGFSYKYDSNVVYKYSAQLLPQTLVFSSNNNFNQLNDFCFTQKLFQRKLNEYKEIMPYWNPGSIYIVKDGMILNFKLPQNIDSSGISNLLLYNRSQNKMLYFNAFESGYKFYDYIPQDTYDAVALYNDGRYLKYDNVFLKKYYYTEVNMSNLPLQKPDSFSAKWLMLNLKKCYNNNTFKQDENQLRKAYPNDVVISSITIAPVRAFGNTVSGFVYDKEGLPLQGATVTITGTSNGTVTDESGYFVLNIIGKNASLAVSFVGYETATVYATAGSRINITMTQMESYLEEVVVIGYGTTRKRSVTGSASSISSNEMMRNPSENIDNALQGKVAGVSITKTNEEDEAENKLYDELRLLNGLRSNFSDVGFWQPALYTNKKGEAKFSITFPDNITSWNAVVFAMNRQLKTGTLKTAIKSYKPLMAELKTPSFLIAGDTSFFAANIRNYTKDSVISGVVNFSVNNKTELQNNIRFTSSKQDKLPVPASSEDSLTASYLFTRNDGYNDGEQRTIPIFSVGTEVAKGTLNILRNGDSIYLQANNNEKIHVNITADNLDIYMNAAYYLTGYQYACNEQLASKLIGLLNYKLYKQFKEEKFENDKQINEIIKRLRDNQNSKKLWSWWGQSDETSFWMSAHIIRALKMARDAGYEVNTSFNQIAVDYADIIPYRRISLNDIEIIHALSEWDAKQNYARAIDTLEKIVRRNEAVEDSLAIAFAHENKRYKPQSYLKEKLLLWDMRRKYNLGYVRDSLTKYLKKDILGRIYCEDGKQERYWYANDLTNTLIAYRMLKKDSALQPMKEAMQLYILATKNKGWNTYYASSAVMEILPDLLAASATKKQAATVAVSGKENKTISGFPYDIDLLPSEQLLIKKQTGIPLIYSAYSMQRVTQKNISDAFDITTSLGGDKLIAGQPIQLKTTLTVKQKNAEYVMIEIPIPASCSYQSKTNYYRFPEVHREYFKDRTVIFCQNLPEGVYTFTIDLLPRFTGKYSLNPAKASLMYFPVIEANNDWRKISVE